MSTFTTAGLNEMLREYAPHSLITDKFKKDNFVWNQFEMDKSWKNGASFQLPWEFSEASDMQMGSLVAADDIGDVGTYKKAILTVQPEMWSALKLHERDLSRYGDLKQSFLKIFPEKLESLIDRMRMNVACIILRNGAIALATADGTAGGVLKVDKPQFLTLQQRVLIKDADSAGVVAYVKQINMSTKEVLFHSDRTASSVAVNLTAFTVASKAKVLLVGSDAETFTTLADYLLPASLGGKDTIHGVSKLSAPLLQPQVIDGSSITAANVLDKLYDYYFEIKELGKVKKGDMWVPYNVFKHAAKKAQESKRYMEGGKESGHGFSRIKLIGPDGEMTLTALSDMPSNMIYMPDTADFNFVGDTFFDRKRQLTGEEFFTVRKTSGYEFLIDICARFDFVAKKLNSSAAIHSINLT